MRAILLTWCFLLAAATPLVAQPKAVDRILDGEPRKYVPFDIDPNYQRLLKNRFQLEKQLGSLKDLMQKLSADPQKMKLDPQMLKDLKLDDPQMRRLIKEWMERDPDMKQTLQKWLKDAASDKQPSSTAALQKTLRSIFEQPAPKIDAPLVTEPPTPTKGKPIEVPKPKEDPLAKIAERAMKNAENSKLGDWLRDSPAWQDALADLRASINSPKVSGWDLGDLNKKLGLPNEKAWKLGEGWLDGLRKLPSPKLDGWKVDFKMPAVGQMPAAPNINGPSLPNFGTPALPTMSVGLNWLLFIVLFVLVAWLLYRWTRRASAVERERTALGPWPVRPEAVSTRAELVQAFDYLALVTLGLQVKCWNHQAVALRWSEQTPACAMIAVALARLYELARYTDGAEQLAAGERDEARRSLRQIAEAF